MTIEKSANENENIKRSGNQKKIRACQIYLLNGQEFRCDVEKQANGIQLLNQIYDLLNILEYDYFGLFFKDLADNKYWLEPNKAIKKQLKNGPWSFYFAVKFYPPDPSQLLEDITRYYMVLQIRDDIVGGRLPCSFVTHALLGSYVVQSELGDYDRSEMKKNYVDNFSFAPNQTKELEDRVIELHKTHRGQTPEQAELNFLENAKKLPMYGVDLHVAQDCEGVAILVGVSWNGVSVYRDGTQINRFSWPRIVKLSYVRSKFYTTLRPLDGEMQMSMIGFKMQNHRSAKQLWKSAVEHHAFFRLVRSDNAQPSKFIRVGSKFRYSGRTQQETRRAVSGSERRSAPEVKRTHSLRLRSDGGELSPVKSVLNPVPEEEPQPPKLPEKKEKKPVVQEVTVTETKTTVETIELQERKPIELSRHSSSNSLSSQSDEQSETAPLTDHQKQIHKLKVEFLQSPHHPAKSTSRDSLDALDARLPPKKPPRASDYVPNQPPTSQTDEDVDTVQTVTETVVTTETIVVVTETDSKDKDDHGAIKENGHQSDSDESSEHFESIQSEKLSLRSSPMEDKLEQDNSEEEEVESKATASSFSRSGSQSSQEHDLEQDPDLVIPDQEPLLVEEDDADRNFSSSSSSSASSVSDQEDLHPGITTVETRTVRVEEVIIPLEENEVHEISLTNDENDSIAVNPTEGSVSSLSSVSSASRDSGEDRQQEQDDLASNGSGDISDDVIDLPPFTEPPTVKTEAVVVDSYVEETPAGTTSPPVVHTQTKTITYESKSSVQSRSAGGDDAQVMDSSSWAADSSTHTQLLSSQIITSETDSTITTTEITKVTRGGVSETHIEKNLVTTGNVDVDHYQAMADTIMDTQMNPKMNITKVVVHEERPMLENNQHS